MSRTFRFKPARVWQKSKYHWNRGKYIPLYDSGPIHPWNATMKDTTNTLARADERQVIKQILIAEDVEDYDYMFTIPNKMVSEWDYD